MSQAYKRPFVPNYSDPNGRSKWQKMTPSASNSSTFTIPHGATVFRVICPNSKSGGVIGKGGTIISKIREKTGARVKLEERVPGCGSRIVLIIGSKKDNTASNEHDKEDNKADATEGGVKADKEVDEEDNKEKGNTSALESSKPSKKESSSAQNALMLVFERIMEVELESNGGGENKDVATESSSVTIELLIMQTQVGHLLENDGSIIKHMESDSGAHISVLSRDKIPACALPQEEVLQITGEINSIRKALQSVSQFLIEHPAKHQVSITRPTNSNSRQEACSSGKFRSPQGPHFPNRTHNQDAPHFPNFPENAGLVQNRGGAPEFIVFRMICPNDRVGSVIGKGGNTVRSLHLETGSEIRILDTSPQTDDRLIIVSCPAIPVDGLLPAQDGVLRVQQRISMAASGGRENVLGRLIVSSNQIGCILGKGGSVISEMRKNSGANIRVLSRDQTPPYVSDHEELVQVSGELSTVQNALLQITDKLKDHCFRMIHGGHPPFIGQMPPPPFGAPFGRDFSPPRRFPDYPPFQNEFPGHPFEERPPFPHGPHGFEIIPPAPWEHQAMRNSGSMPVPEYPSGPPQWKIGGFSGGNNLASFYKTIEVAVPRAIVPSICGEDGGCLRQIREISEAKITISEPKPNDVEAMIMITGNPEQTHAAQSLIHAFVLSETAAT